MRTDPFSEPGRGRLRAASRRGAAAVEFGMAASLLFLFMFAAIEFARLNLMKHAIEHASYLAARRGMITGARATDVVDVAQAHLDALDVEGAAIMVNPTRITDETSLIEVTIEVPMAGNSWISPLYFGDTITAQTRMLTERAAANMANAMN